MTTPHSRLELQERLSLSPFIRFLGLEVLDANAERGELSMRIGMRPEFERQAGSGQFHGGVIAALVDTVGDYALIMQLGFGVPTINFSTDFLRPAVGQELTATARIRRSGKSIGVVDIDVLDISGKVVAIGRGCYSTQQRG